LNKDRGYYSFSICAFTNFVSFSFPVWSGKVVYGHIDFDFDFVQFCFFVRSIRRTMGISWK
jgi:hypothetical protein